MLKIVLIVKKSIIKSHENTTGRGFKALVVKLLNYCDNNLTAYIKLKLITYLFFIL